MELTPNEEYVLENTTCPVCKAGPMQNCVTTLDYPKFSLNPGREMPHPHSARVLADPRFL